jgi:hypothetical protein
VTTTRSRWRLGIELLRICLVCGGLSLLLNGTDAASGARGGASAVDCDNSSDASDALDGASAGRPSEAAASTTRGGGSIPRDGSDTDADDNEDDDDHGLRRAHALSSGRAPDVGAWRLTALGVDPSIFLTGSHSLRAPPR